VSADTDNTFQEVLRQYGIVQPAITPVAAGLINHTWQVEEQGNKYILQRLNPMFSTEIHQDIAIVTDHLDTRGIITPRLVQTRDNRLYHQGGCRLWRLYHYIEGITFNAVEKPAIAFQSGLTLARFHQGLLDLDYRFQHSRSGVHDTQRHIQALQTALQAKQAHSRYKDILPLAQEILEWSKILPTLPELTARKVHGDPKINNFLFDKSTEQGICMLDFDTLGNMTLPLELGDAMRSWCNPAGENSDHAFFSLENFSAGVEGYASQATSFILPAEWQTIIVATRIIYIELATRFCADALNESFFSWDQTRFGSHSEHNQIRATSQLNAFKSLNKQLTKAERILKNVFDTGC